jgi:oxidoreductase
LQILPIFRCAKFFKQHNGKSIYDYQFQFAQAARENDAPHYAPVSALGANAKSKAFYTRLKGPLDEVVQKLGFPYCMILHPPMLEPPNTD